MMTMTERMHTESDIDIDIETKIEEEALLRMQRRLQERQNYLQRTSSGRDAVCIYRVPPGLTGLGMDTIEPEVVAIGPYHRGKDRVLEFENYKYTFLDYVLSFTRKEGIDLDRIIRSLAELERSARRSYSEPSPISSADFIEMMVLDSCFVLGYMLHVHTSQEDEPSLCIQMVTKDLLKLENQIPYFVIQTVYGFMKNINSDSLELLTLKFFNLALPRDQEILIRSSLAAEEPKHLLDLVHSSYLPSILNQGAVAYVPPNSEQEQSIQSVRLRRKSGIRIRPFKAAKTFLQITFKKGTLQIPPIALNDYTTTLFVNCIALEQCTQHVRTHFSAYAFMACLITSTRDVTFLCGDGIIAPFSKDDRHIARMFHQLGEITAINIRDCYLSTQIKEIEAYYSSNWATLKRTYLSTPWSVISIFYAFLILVLAGIQTVIAILSYNAT